MTETYCAVFQRVFQDTDNRIGKGFAIFGIYLFSICYCKIGFHMGTSPHEPPNDQETKQKTLEEIAAAFGDKVVRVDERGVMTEETTFEATKVGETGSVYVQDALKKA
ncbi:hypothetical protein SLS62_008622 [Diatrype stigma]|uniref:Uncharacterized protein n=1 Tax=Diatrype stigma TaxID=117547 RepID=A0AAN9UHE0_9PEZI